MALRLFRLPNHVMVCSCYCLHAILRSRSKSALERLSCVTIRARHDCDDIESDDSRCSSSLVGEHGSCQEFSGRALEECEKFFWRVELDSPCGDSCYEERIERVERIERIFQPDTLERRITRSMTAHQESSKRDYPVYQARYPIETLRKRVRYRAIAVRIGVGVVIA